MPRFPSAAYVLTEAKIDDVKANIIESKSGDYDGNGTANRAISHGGAEPVLTVISKADGTKLYFIVNGMAKIVHIGNGVAISTYSVTVPDSTNFYVGNAAEYTESANVLGVNFKWTVFYK